MTTMSDLPQNLVGKILCRVPMTSLKTVRSVCKQWNTLSKNRIFGKAHEQFLGFMMMDSRICSLRFDLQGIRNDGEHLAEPSIKQIIMFNQIEVSKVFHCDGLVLCVLKDNTRLLVWNPYLGQTRWIQPRNNFHRLDRYALGFDTNRNHKILRFVDDYLFTVQTKFFGYEIYDFSFDSWRVLDVTPDWDIDFYQRGVSLKGNTYFFARHKLVLEGDGEFDTTENPSFLLCFDFTAEKFGPRLTLPFHYIYDETVTLSCVKEEQLSVLYQRMYQDIEIMEIWVSTKIEPNAVSWSKFLRVDMRPLTGFQFYPQAGSFYIDKEKKVAVVFDLSKYERTETCLYQMAYIIGQDGYYKSVNIGEAPNLAEPGKFGYTYTCPIYCIPLVCSSYYVPSLVQID